MRVMEAARIRLNRFFLRNIPTSYKIGIFQRTFIREEF